MMTDDPLDDLAGDEDSFGGGGDSPPAPVANPWAVVSTKPLDPWAVVDTKPIESQWTKDNPLIIKNAEDYKALPFGGYFKHPKTGELAIKKAPAPEAVQAEAAEDIDLGDWQPAVQNPGWGGSLWAGLVHGGKGTFQTGQVIGGQTPVYEEPEIVAAQPIGWGDWSSPNTLIKKFLYGFAESAPTMAMALSGGALGSAVTGGPETPVGWAGGIAGTVAGAAAGHTLQSLGANFGQALHEGKDPEAAWSLALHRTGIGAAGSGVGFGLFGWSPFASYVKKQMFETFGVDAAKKMAVPLAAKAKDIALQAGVAQPGVAVGETVARNVSEGKPALEGATDAIPGAIAGTFAPLAVHEGLRQINAGRARPATPDGTPPPDSTSPPGAPPGTPPAGLPTVGEALGMKMSGGVVEPMTVVRHTPQGDVVLRDSEGHEHRMTAQDVATYRAELPAEPGVAELPPIVVTPEGEAAPVETAPPPRGGSAEPAPEPLPEVGAARTLEDLERDISSEQQQIVSDQPPVGDIVQQRLVTEAGEMAQAAAPQAETPAEAPANALPSRGAVPTEEGTISNAPVRAMPPTNQSAGAGVLPDLPRSVYAPVSPNETIEPRSAQEGQLPELRGSVQAPGEAPAAAVPDVRGGERGDAPPGLRSSPGRGVAVPPLPPEAAPRREPSVTGPSPETVDQARQLVAGKGGQVSIGWLMSQLKIPREDANAILAQLEAAGVVGPVKGNKQRQVLTPEAPAEVAPVPEPVAAPEPPVAPEPQIVNLNGMGNAMTGGFYDGLFQSLVDGRDTFAGVRDPVIARARPFFDAGVIRSPDDLLALVQAGWDAERAGLRAPEPVAALEPAPVEVTPPVTEEPIVEAAPVVEPPVEVTPPTAHDIQQSTGTVHTSVPAERGVPFERPVEPAPEPSAAPRAPVYDWVDEVVRAYRESGPEAAIAARDRLYAEHKPSQAANFVFTNELRKVLTPEEQTRIREWQERQAEAPVPETQAPAPVVEPMDGWADQIARIYRERGADAAREAYERIVNENRLASISAEALRAKFQELLTPEERGRDVRSAPQAVPEDAPEAPRGGEPAPDASAPRVIDGKHTKTGADIVTVQLPGKVSKEEFIRLGTEARKMGGYYSAYRGRGAVPGFIFKTREAADRFAALAGREPVERPTRGTRHPEEITENVEKAREETNPDPSPAQIESGVYRKGHLSFHGLPFVIETPQGGIRRGVDARTGEPWEVEMPADYGYLSKTVGADNEHVDAYLGPDHASQRVWVVDQVHADTGAFDEGKVLLGFPDLNAARTAYEAAFSDGRGAERIGNITPMSLDELKTWLREGNTKNPVGQQALSDATAAALPETPPPLAPTAETAAKVSAVSPEMVKRVDSAIAYGDGYRTPKDVLDAMDRLLVERAHPIIQNPGTPAGRLQELNRVGFRFRERPEPLAGESIGPSPPYIPPRQMTQEQFSAWYNDPVRAVAELKENRASVEVAKKRGWESEIGKIDDTIDKWRSGETKGLEYGPGLDWQQRAHIERAIEEGERPSPEILARFPDIAARFRAVPEIHEQGAIPEIGAPIPVRDLGPPGEPKQTAVSGRTPEGLEASVVRAAASRTRPTLSREQRAESENVRQETARRFDDAIAQVMRDPPKDTPSSYRRDAETRAAQIFQGTTGVDKRKGFVDGAVFGEKRNPPDKSDLRGYREGFTAGEKWRKDNPPPEVGTIPVIITTARGHETRLTLPRDPEIIQSAKERYTKLDPGLLYGLAEERTGFAEQPFFSALTRAVEAIPQPKAPGAQWANMIRNLTNKGVKQDEIAWSGVLDWLRDNPGLVTKDQVLDQLRANEVRVQEVEHGGNSPMTEEQKQAIVDWAERQPWVSEDQPLDREMLRRQIDEAAAGHTAAIGELEGYGAPYEMLRPFYERGNGSSKYGQYTLPGGSNYRELLLTLPDRRTSRPEPFPELVALRQRYIDATVSGNEQLRRQIEPTLRAAENIYRRQEDEWLQQQPATYRTSHWDEPNVLAHIRMDDRTDAEGRKILHVAEIQSDWGQKIRRSGAKPTKAEKDALSQETRQYVPDATWDSVSHEELTAAGAPQELIDRVTGAWGRDRAAPPEMPLDKTWHELAMKRVLRYAAEHGYDRLTFDTGATQADRYDLSKHVDHISYAKDGDGTWSVSARKDGRELLERRKQTPDQIADALGKDIADKITNGAGHEMGAPAGSGELRGLDLKVGGDGMKGFYDKILPAFVNRYGKKWGAKVEDADILIGKRVDAPVHAVDITEPMRDSVMKGQALWEGDRENAGPRLASTVEDMRQSYDAFAAERQGEQPNTVARDWVVDRGRETGHEHIVAFDRDGNVIGAATLGLPGEVALPAAARARLNDPNAGMVIQHNHPGGRSLSTTDMQLAAAPGVEWVVAHNHEGDISAVRLSPEVAAAAGANPDGALPALVDTIKAAANIVRSSLMMQTLGKKISAREADLLYHDMINRALDAAGVIDYVSSRAPDTLSDKVYRSIIERAAMKAAERAADHWGLDTGDVRGNLDRSTNAVQPDEGMARLPGAGGERGVGEPGAPGAEERGRGRTGAASDGQEAVVDGSPGDAFRDDLAEERTPFADLADTADRRAFEEATAETPRGAGGWSRLLRTLGVGGGSPGTGGRGDYFFNAVNKNWTTPLGLARIDPNRSGVKEAAETAMRLDRDRFMAGYTEAMSSWKDRAKADQDAVLAAAEILTLEGRDVPADGRAVLVENTAHPLAELSKPGDVLDLRTPERIQMFGDLSRAMDKAWDDRIAEVARTLGWEGEPTYAAIRQAAEAAIGREKTNLERSAAIVASVEFQRRAAYLPLMRHGDYFVRVVPKAGTEDKPGIPGWTGDGFAPTIKFQLMDSRTSAEKVMGGTRSGTPHLVSDRIAELRKTFPEGEYDIEHGYMFQKGDQIKDLPLPAVEKLMMLIGNDVREQYRNHMTGEAADAEYRGAVDSLLKQVAEELKDSAAEQIRGARMAGPLRQRRGTPGYDPDFIQSIGKYFNWAAWSASGLKHRPAIERANLLIHGGTDSTGAFINGHPDPQVRDFWTQWDRRNEVPTGVLDSALNMARQGAFYWTIGGNAASALKNLLDGPVINMPILSTGLGTTGRAKAYGEYIATSTGLLKGVRIGKNGLDVDVMQAARDAPERAMLKDAEATGLIHATGMRELANMAREGEDQILPQQKFNRRVLEIWASGFGTTDKLNRAALMLSAYRVANREGMDRINAIWGRDGAWQNVESKTPEAFARFMVERSQGRWGIDNKTGFARTQMGGMLMQFRSFEQNSLATLHSMMWKMGPEGKISALLTLGTMGMIAGALGLPFVTDIEKGYEWVHKLITGVDPNVEEKFLQFMKDDPLGLGANAGKTMLHGIEPFGIDLGSVGIGNPLSRAQSPLDMAGPAASIFLGAPYKAYERQKSGQSTASQVAELMPAGVRNLIKAYGVYPDEGVRTLGTGQVVLRPQDIEPSTQVIAGMGFRPKAIADPYREKERDRRLGEAVKDAAHALNVKFNGLNVSAMMADQRGDHAQAQALRAEAQQAIANAPPGVKASMHSLRQALRQAIDPHAAAVKGAPKAVRPQVAQPIYTSP